MSEAAVLPGAEPFSAEGNGSEGALVLHGFTGSPQSVRGLAEAFAAAGFAVELPRLPGHGTTMEDMLTTRWEDWLGAAERAYDKVASRCERLVVAGLSMGGTLATAITVAHPEVAGLVVVNPVMDPPAASFRDILRSMLEQGISAMPGIGSDIADPDQTELSYGGTPIEPLLSLCEACDRLLPQLNHIRCPVLVMTSPQDHVVPPVSSDVLAGNVSGPVERAALARSFHVATLDYDRDEIESRAVEFALKVTAS